MAANILKSLRRQHPRSLCRWPPTGILPSSLSFSFLRRPLPSLSLSSPTSATSPLSSTITPPSLNPTFDKENVSLHLLRRHLSTQNFREADEETRRLLIILAGKGAEKRGYVFFSEVQFIPEAALKAIDQLWREHSRNKFGYSVQKRIWERVNKDFTTFFVRIGWMKKLETEVEQYNYRVFPEEFKWELNDETPGGHLPLTNALRGTRLLSSILSHPAFNE